MPRNAAATRARIMDAAQLHVMRRGFSATSVDDIQAAAGISRGTFFYHFPTKDDLARALLERYAASDRELTDELMARAAKLSRDPLQQVLIFLRLHEEVLQHYVREEDPGCLFASYSYEAGLFDGDTHATIGASLDHFRALVATRLEAAVQRHPPVVPVDPAVLADMASALFQGGFILSRVRGDARLMIDHLHQFTHLLEAAFGVAEHGA